MLDIGIEGSSPVPVLFLFIPADEVGAAIPKSVDTREGVEDVVGLRAGVMLSKAPIPIRSAPVLVELEFATLIAGATVDVGFVE